MFVCMVVCICNYTCVYICTIDESDRGIGRWGIGGQGGWLPLPHEVEDEITVKLYHSSWA